MFNLVEYISGGDLRDPVSSDSTKIIAHVCNDIGVMGAGVAKELYNRWPIVKSSYLNNKTHTELGAVILCSPEPDIVIANCIAQHGIRKSSPAIPPIRYDAFTECMSSVFKYSTSLKTTSSIHVPHLMGCGLAGGDWTRIHRILTNFSNAYNQKVYIYDKYNQNT